MAALATSYRKEMRIVRGRAQLGWLALLIAVLLYLPTVLETRAIFNFYFLTETQVLGIGLAQVNFALIAIMGAVALNLLVGYTGLLSMGHSAFFAIGAMGGGILGVQAGLPFIVVVLGSGLFGAAVGTLVGLPSLRLRGLYLLLSTLALHFIVLYLFLRYQLGQFGPAGISFETATLFGFDIATDKRWYFVLLVVAALFIVVTRNLLKMREGRAFIAIRDHEVAAAATGVNPSMVKLKAFAVTLVHGQRRGRAVRLQPRHGDVGELHARLRDRLLRDGHHRRHGLAARRRAGRDRVAAAAAGAADALAVGGPGHAGGRRPAGQVPFAHGVDHPRPADHPDPDVQARGPDRASGRRPRTR